MYIGIVCSIVAGFIWSCVNVIDKTVVSKYITDPRFLIMVFSLVSLLTGLAIIPFTGGQVSGWPLVLLVLSAVAHTLGTIAYFFAMKTDEPSRVVPLFSLTTVFIVFLSIIFLGEIFSGRTYLGIAIIIAGSFIISTRNSLSSVLKSRALWMMALGSLGYAVAYIINKHLLAEHTFWQVFAWQRLLVGMFGAVLFIFYYRRVREIFRAIRKKFVLLSFSAEVLNVIGTFFLTVASAFWYVTLVEAVVSVQYVFIFFWAIAGSRFKPALFSEEFSRRAILQKAVSIALIVVGIFMIT